MPYARTKTRVQATRTLYKSMATVDDFHVPLDFPKTSRCLCVDKNTLIKFAFIYRARHNYYYCCIYNIYNILCYCCIFYCLYCTRRDFNDRTWRVNRQINIEPTIGYYCHWQNNRQLPSQMWSLDFKRFLWENIFLNTFKKY